LTKWQHNINIKNNQNIIKINKIVLIQNISNLKKLNHPLLIHQLNKLVYLILQLEFSNLLKIKTQLKKQIDLVE